MHYILTLYTSHTLFTLTIHAGHTKEHFIHYVQYTGHASTHQAYTLHAYTTTLALYVRHTLRYSTAVCLYRFPFCNPHHSLNAQPLPITTIIPLPPPATEKKQSEIKHQIKTNINKTKQLKFIRKKFDPDSI